MKLKTTKSKLGSSRAQRSVDDLFNLARLLPPALLKRAIKLVRSLEDYPRREELLKILRAYLVRRRAYPESWARDTREGASKLRGGPLTPKQIFARRPPKERAAFLERKIALIEKQVMQEPKSRMRVSRAETTKLLMKKARRIPLRPPTGVGGGGVRKALPRMKNPIRTGPRAAGSVLGKHPTWDRRSIDNFFKRQPTNMLHEERRRFDWINAGASTVGPAPSAKKAAKKRKRTKPVVSTGFALPTQASKPISSAMPLMAEEKYYFWLQVGERVKGTIEVKEELLPTKKLPTQAILDVVLFAFNGGLKIIPGQDTGKLKLDDGTVTVEHQPTNIPLSEVSGDSSLLERRLFFPVITPKETGNFRLRCNIYYRTVLVQSRIVHAQVMRRPRTKKRALQAKVDYTLSRTLSAKHVSGFTPHLLSVMINSNGNGTHDFFFFGDQKFEKDNISFNGQELQELIEQARNAYALAAWGSNNPWGNQNYRYDQTPAQNLQQLKADLIRFAIRGYNIYDKVINRLAGGAKNAEALTELMRKPGMVQIALKESPSFILPAAIIYDYSIDVDADNSKFSLCPTFLKALEATSPLEDSACFKGNCPTKDDDTVVCPSGFWGFRHQLGLPLSVADGPDAPTTIDWSNKPIMTVGVSTDPLFILREQHLQKLQSLRPAGLEWNYGSTRDAVIKKLKETKPQLVYFYCHGGVSETRPYIQVGTPDASGNLSPSFLREKKIRWESSRPLVFINGCHTTALEPEKAIEFISPFIESANAAGVIGTEITIFEPIATAFGEECLRRFLAKSTIGEAVRCARLKLLKNANPLGLVYIPYVMASLSLVEH